MSENSVAIEVKNLKKSYKKVEVLRDVNFQVEKGTIFALLGANGSGKTTTINILTTILPADSGTATVNGFNILKEADQVRKNISLTGQFAAVDDVLTGRENLILIGELRHVENPKNLAEELLGQFDLAEAGDRRTATYSGGMRRRLDIAMSLIGNPSVIFLDEPTNGLDIQSRNMMWEMIKTLVKNGTTIFLTTQYLEEADQLADTIAVLSGGRIVKQGTPQELKNILPEGKIEFLFHDQKQLDAAAKLFEQQTTVRDDEARSLLVNTDGSLEQISELFNQLRAAKVEVAEFSRKEPTLDEAFLAIISDHKEKK